MLFTLSNDDLTIKVNSKGAELISIKGANGVESLWQADPKFWGRHAPILFPIVGRLKDDYYEYNGKRYQLGQHGFARDMEFELADQTSDSLTMVLTDNADTHAQYPFAFQLFVKYTIEKATVKVNLTVKNTDDQEMLFSIGAHPAFNVPLTGDAKFDDYHLKVAPRDEYEQIPLESSLSDEAHQHPINLREPLTMQHDVFKNDAVILNLHQRPIDVMLESKDSHAEQGVSLHASDAKYIGFWSTYPDAAGFVCLEPWWGIADDVNADHQLADKKGIEHLDSGNQFDAEFDITVY